MTEVEERAQYAERTELWTRRKGETCAGFIVSGLYTLMNEDYGVTVKIDRDSARVLLRFDERTRAFRDDTERADDESLACAVSDALKWHYTKGQFL